MVMHALNCGRVKKMQYCLIFGRNTEVVISSFVLLNNTVIAFQSIVIGSGIKWWDFDNTITNNSDITDTAYVQLKCSLRSFW